MPHIEIRMLPLPSSALDVAAVMKDVSARAAAALGIPPAKVWTTWEFLPAHHYVSDLKTVPVQAKASHPPLVHVTLYEGRTPELKAALLNAIADSLCDGLGLEKGNVFIAIHEARAHELYVGGKVRA